MPHRGLVALFVVLIAMALLVLTAVEALAAEEVQLTEQVHLKPKAPITVSVGAPITGTVNFGKPFASISSLCFDFQFVDNLLDPSETLIVEFAPTVFGAGFSNTTAVAQSSRTLCVAQPEVISSYLKGLHQFTITVEQGSVTIENLTIRVVGIR